MLEIGTKAPEFTLPDQNGENHSLKDYRGKKVILYFYPRSTVCLLPFYQTQSWKSLRLMMYGKRKRTMAKFPWVLLGLHIL